MSNVENPDPLAPLRGQPDLARWECWIGVSNLIYARRRRTSPPAVLRAETAEDLADQIRQWEAGRLG